MREGRIPPRQFTRRPCERRQDSSLGVPASAWSQVGPKEKKEKKYEFNQNLQQIVFDLILDRL